MTFKAKARRELGAGLERGLSKRCNPLPFVGDLLMPGAKVFYSYSSADEQLRNELETHLSLMKREGLIETWSFRQIEAGSDWKTAINANLNQADVILLMVSANFIASDYCWDIEMDKAIERHETGDAIVVPIILKPCDWHSAPFARLQALPDSAKPVSGWRPRDRAWENVVAGLRRTLSARRNRGESPLAEPETPDQPAPDADVRPSALETARRISQNAVVRKSREERLRSEGYQSFESEVSKIYSSLVRIVSEIHHDSPGLLIQAEAAQDRCVVRLGRVTFNIYSYQTNPITESCVVGRLWFGGILFPSEVGKSFYPSRPMEFKELTFFFDLGREGEWNWHPDGSAEPLASVDVAERCITNLLEFHEAVESGDIEFPELDFR